MPSAARAKRSRPRGIPRSAIAREPRTGTDEATRYFSGRRVVACVYWHATGHPEWLWYCDARGKKHGLERYYFEDGRLKWEARHVHGLQHGLQRQWDHKGRLICATRFVRGTGRDLWWDNGALAELREIVDGKRHGVEQWWSSPRTVHTESHFHDGLDHGVFRQWGARGRLEPGFPTFHIQGRLVSRERYLLAAISDPTLRPYLAEEDRPSRKCPVPPGGLVSRAVRPKRR